MVTDLVVEIDVLNLIAKVEGHFRVAKKRPLKAERFRCGLAWPDTHADKL